MLICRYADTLIPGLVKLRAVFLALYVIWQYVVPQQISQVFEGIRYNIVTTALLICVVASFGFSVKYRMKREWSYSFYLYHMVVINWIIQTLTQSFSGAADFVRWFLITVTATFVCAFLSHHFIAVKLTGALESKIQAASGGGNTDGH